MSKNTTNYDFSFRQNKDGKIECLRKEKTLFGYKMKPTSIDNIFTFTRDLLAKEHSFVAYPNVQGMSPIQYLSEKAKYCLIRGISDFGCHTNWKVKGENKLIETKVIDNQNINLFELSGNIVVTDDNGNEIFTIKDFSQRYASDKEIPAEVFQGLYQNASNGKFQTARDIDTLNQNFRKNEDEKMWICEECGMKFRNIDEFYCHLIEEAHLDSVFLSHPYDAECQRVFKTVVAKKQQKDPVVKEFIEGIKNGEINLLNLDEKYVELQDKYNNN